MGIMFVSVKEMHENFWVALSRDKNKTNKPTNQPQNKTQEYGTKKKRKNKI